MRSEGDKSLKEKSKDKSQQHVETKRGPGRPKTVVYEKYDLNQHVSWKAANSKGAKNAGGTPKDRDSCQKVNNLTLLLMEVWSIFLKENDELEKEKPKT